LSQELYYFLMPLKYRGSLGVLVFLRQDKTPETQLKIKPVDDQIWKYPEKNNESRD